VRGAIWSLRTAVGLGCLFIVVGSPRAVAQAAKLVAPVRCEAPDLHGASCGSDLTLAEAQSSFERTKATKRCDAGAVAVEEECEERLSAVDANICGEVEAISSHYVWFPPNELKDGKAALERLQEMARSGSPRPKGKDRGTVVVQASESIPAEEHLAICDVVMVDGVAGPPRDCATVAIITPDGSWLRGSATVRVRTPTYDYYIGQTCLYSYTIRVSGAINIDFEIVTNQHAADFSSALVNALQNELQLKTQVRTAENGDFSITSVAGLRFSRVLPGKWWETVDFDLQVGKSSDKKQATLYVSGVAHVLASPDNLANISQLNGLNNAQTKSYADKLDDEVNNAIKHACKHVVSEDAKTIVCE
jgi:hypothetical protein